MEQHSVSEGSGPWQSRPGSRGHQSGQRLVLLPKEQTGFLALWKHAHSCVVGRRGMLGHNGNLRVRTLGKASQSPWEDYWAEEFLILSIFLLALMACDLQLLEIIGYVFVMSIPFLVKCY